MKLFKIFLALIIVTAYSCNSSDEVRRDTGRAYFPVKVRQFQTYAVEEVKYTFGVPDTTRYELKLHVVDSFINSAAEITYVIHRSKRPVGGVAWSYFDTWSAQPKNDETIVFEGNIPFVRLKYPVSEGLTWNGNAYNAEEVDEFEVELVKHSTTVNGMEFKDCVTVLENDNEDFIVELDQRKVVYAKHVGLIYKEYALLGYCTEEDCIGEQRIDEGSIVKHAIIAYGME